MADAQILQYLIEPGEESVAGLDVFDVPVRPNESFLRQVQRIFTIAHQT
jgi:hypothetical protein